MHDKFDNNNDKFDSCFLYHKKISFKQEVIFQKLTSSDSKVTAFKKRLKWVKIGLKWTNLSMLWVRQPNQNLGLA